MNRIVRLLIAGTLSDPDSRGSVKSPSSRIQYWTTKIAITPPWIVRFRWNSVRACIMGPRSLKSRKRAASSGSASLLLLFYVLLGVSCSSIGVSIARLKWIWHEHEAILETFAVLWFRMIGNSHSRYRPLLQMPTSSVSTDEVDQH